MFRSVVLILFLILTSTYGLIAQAKILNPSKPPKCPSEAALMSIKLNASRLGRHRGQPLWYHITRKPMESYGDENGQWYFEVRLGFWEADSDEEALRIANDALPTIKFESGPDSYDGKESWSCSYTMDRAMMVETNYVPND